MLLELGLGFAIGISLGLLGGGGSILTVPALVYLVGQSPQTAMTTSLAIVGANSMFGAWIHSRQGTFNLRVALVFGGAGMGVAYLASHLSVLFTPQVLMIAFAGLMLLVGLLMILRRPPTVHGPAHTPGMLTIIASGAAVGLLTGLLGVGGGFLIVPALVLVIGLPMAEAISTSLLIIAVNSLAGFMGHLSSGPLDIPLTLIFVSAGFGGTLVGARLAQHLPAERLRQLFGLLVIVLGALLLIDQV